MSEQGVGMSNSMSRVHCKVFEDNSDKLPKQHYPRLDPKQNTSMMNTGLLESTWSKEKDQFTRCKCKIK